jgi:4-alpha-glucanotransferase
MNSGQDVLNDFERASRHEWRLADGVGGYAAGTASGAPTRRAHAALAAASPEGALTALVLRFEERLTVGATLHELAAAFSAGRAPRAGAFSALEAFESDPFPRWRWRFGDTVIERVLRLIEGHAALVASWRLIEGPAVKLSVAPLLTARAPREFLRENPDFRGAAQGIPGRVRLETLPGRPGVTLWHNGAFLPARGWAKGLAYPLDLATEDDGTAPELQEDGFLPGWTQTALDQPGSALHLVLSPEEGLFRALAAESRLGTPPARTLHDCVAAIDRDALEHRASWRKQALSGADTTARQAAAVHGGEAAARGRRAGALVDASDAPAVACAMHLRQGLVRRGGRLTFSGRWPDGRERGADVLRAASGLVTLRAFEPARAVARGYLEYLNEGLAPESFDPVDGTPCYGDPEPSLWLIHLVDLIARRSPVPPGEDAFLRDTAWPALEGVVQHLRAGSSHGVRCDRDGLLWAGEGHEAQASAATNALWYHALVAMAQLGKLLGRRENAAFYLAWAHELQRRYPESFWDERSSALFESLSASGPRRGITPAQLWSLGLAPALLATPHAERLLATLERELLASDGLRERPGDEEVDPAWLGAWAAAMRRSGTPAEPATSRVGARLAAAAARPTLEPLAAAEVLRAWIEDCARVEPALADQPT